MKGAGKVDARFTSPFLYIQPSTENFKNTPQIVNWNILETGDQNGEFTITRNATTKTRGILSSNRSGRRMFSRRFCNGRNNFQRNRLNTQLLYLTTILTRDLK